MPRIKLEEIIKSFEIKEFSQFFRLKTRAEGNFRLSNERLSQYDDADFFDFVKLGQIEFSESQRLLVASAKVGRDLSERSGKKAQYEKAKRILRELSVYSAGIFIFYDDGGNFRFSLVYPEAVGTKREWSNFRRFTYFVSRELTNKTFLQRVGDGNFSTLEKIKDAFSVEKVTKEFYLEYRKLFDSLMEDLSKNHTFLNEASKNYINTENFAKKLLGQIVFLYFIQKKGWIGVPAGKKWGEGDKNFMGNIYKEAITKKANFYNDYLEKLFYNALNNAHRDSADPSFSKDFGSRIPFLNGGLFEAEYDWKNSLMYLDNKIFQSIFDVFERYNFTVEEESPDDKEIAVDPEMLGKVFENLLPENLRKGKGTYYTPREIVYYMCRESLVNYLVSNHSNITEENIRNYIFYSESFENFKKKKGESFTPGQWKELDDLLANIKVCDPACGSGAFLVGMLNMLVKLRIFLQTTPDSHLIPQKKEYELKREIIQNCIYGVDIDPGAIEIAKLRLWLALVVDYDLEDIEPLPNLDYRLMCGNSLLEEFEGIKFYNGEKETQASLLVDQEKDKKIEALRKKVREYFSIHDDKEKLKKRKEINDIKDWLIGTALQKRYRDLASQKKEAESRANMLDEKSRKQYLSGFSKWLGSSSNIQKALESLHNPKKEKPFFIWKLEFIDVFEEKGGFDVMIANPPYGADIDKDIELYRKAYFEVVKNYADIYKMFFYLGLKILGRGGVETFITPNTYLAQPRYKDLRFYLLKFNIKKIINLGENVFEGVVVPTCITFVNNLPPTSNYLFFDVSVDGKYSGDFNNLNFLKVDLNQVHQNSDRSLLQSFVLKENELVLDKILDVRDAGIQYHRSGIGLKNKGGNDLYDRIFSPDKNSFEKSRPVWYGKLINEYYISDKTDEYFNLGFKSVLKENEAVSFSIEAFDKKDKILWRQTAPFIIAALDNRGLWFRNTIQCGWLRNEFNGKIDLRFILALLNSSYLRYLYQKIVNESSARAFPQVKITHVKKLPIRIVKISEQKPFIDLVDTILPIIKGGDYLENSTKQAKVRDYEKQIDQLVYKLYTLTSEEIKVVEGDK